MSGRDASDIQTAYGTRTRKFPITSNMPRSSPDASHGSFLRHTGSQQCSNKNNRGVRSDREGANVRKRASFK